jgi:dihydrofolate reductase
MISIIAAMAKNRVIGNKGKIPWHISEDYVNFTKTTREHPIIMGQKTFESICGFSNWEGWSSNKPKEIRLLPYRTNIVLTDDPTYKVEGAVIVHSIDDAIENAKQCEGGDEIFFIGGASIFNQVLPIADRVYLTIVDETIEGDTYFPEIDSSVWEEVKSRHRIVRVPGKEVGYYFKIYERKK